MNIGILGDGFVEGEGSSEYMELFTRDIVELTSGEFDVRFPADRIISADWTITGVQAALDKLLADPGVDIILAFGLISSRVVADRGNLPKPVIAPFVMDARLYGFPIKGDSSGVKNFNYINVPDRFHRDIQYFREVVPFKKLAYLFNQHYLETLPGILTAGREMVKEMGIDLQIIGVNTSIDEALAKLPADTEAVYLGPLTNVPVTELEELPAKLIARKLPSFSSPGILDTRKGILASIMSEFLPQVARRIGLNVQRILLDEEPGSIPVDISPIEQLTINMATARAIDIYPDWSVLNEAELLNPEIQEAERKLNLRTAIQEAISVNLDLAAKERSVSAGKQNVKEAISRLLPSVNLSGTGLIIDKDRAEASFGSQAQRSLTGSFSASQLLFSEPAMANLSIQKSLQRGLEREYDQLKLDIALAAATAYLNLLHTKTFERIQRENLKRIRKNLEIARIRDSVGTADPAEVFRWESEIASSRKELVQAEANRELAQFEVNRILNRPLTEPFITVEIGLGQAVMDMTETKFLNYMRNARTFAVFIEFMVKEGLMVSPELAALEAAIKAQERALKSARSSFWAPTLALQSEYANIFSKGGAGSETNSGISQLFQFPEQDNASWNIALNLSFPLFKGGQKTAARLRSEKELEYLQLLQEATSQRIEQRVMSTIHQGSASYSGAEQAQKAVEAGLKSFNVVQEAYTEGVVSLVYLLDAQNAAFLAEQGAANAVFTYLIDMLNVERAVGKIDFFLNIEKQKNFFLRLDDYYKKAGIKLDK